ncbi:uncharacterized protein LOC126560052 [Anopheles maculipalpis]|uniref:uncharacterized protein LOC126560052 n=1 Tax=Anopheles maculipalpis TaxID=1496333 RepID=UPI002158BE26|nr:uncharacterized protein LOC126560052 [Anopheles maculipalpis]
MYAQRIGEEDWNDGGVSFAGNGNVYRRFQDIDGGSNSSASNDTESTTLLDETCRRNDRLYDITPLDRSDRHSRGSTKNKIFLFIITVGLFGIIALGYFPNGNDRGRVGTIAGWGLNTSRETIGYVLPYENTTLIDPTNVCNAEERSGLVEQSEKVFLLIVVCSSADNFEARQAIRDTWGKVDRWNYHQFRRLHERLRGKYLDPKATVGPEYSWQVPSDDDLLQASAGTEANKVPTKSRNSSQSGKNESNSFAGMHFNIKVVFLIGQSKADYVHQRERTSFPSIRVGDSANAQDSAVSTTLDFTHTPSSDGTGAPQNSLFPSGPDVDPAFNPASNEVVDELQQRILNESEVYGDIIQESFIDSYNNLTLKTIMMLKWVTNNCDGKVKFIMKCDDDTFVNVPNLLHVLLGGTVPLYEATYSFYDTKTVAVKSAKNRLIPGKHLLTGFLFCDAKPISDTSSKWYSPAYMYNKDVYPNYLSGTAYLMNLETAKLLYRGTLSTPIFHLEDVYLTGIVADRVKIRRRHHPLFFYSSTKDLCALRGMISHHHLQPSDLRTAYDFITNGTIVCRGPEKQFTDGHPKLKKHEKCQ